ncbi:hypothetical protein, partial [Halomonas sp. KM-1]
MSSPENTKTEDTTTDTHHGLFTLANAFRVAAVLSTVVGLYLFFQAIQFANIVGAAAYEAGLFQLGIAVIVSLFLLLGEKICRYL